MLKNQQILHLNEDIYLKVLDTEASQCSETVKNHITSGIVEILMPKYRQRVLQEDSWSLNLGRLYKLIQDPAEQLFLSRQWFQLKKYLDPIFSLHEAATQDPGKLSGYVNTLILNLNNESTKDRAEVLKTYARAIAILILKRAKIKYGGHSAKFDNFGEGNETLTCDLLKTIQNYLEEEESQEKKQDRKNPKASKNQRGIAARRVSAKKMLEVPGQNGKQIPFGSACKYVKRKLHLAGLLEGMTRKDVFEKVAEMYSPNFGYGDLTTMELKYLTPKYFEKARNESA